MTTLVLTTIVAFLCAVVGLSTGETLDNAQGRRNIEAYRRYKSSRKAQPR